MVGRRSKRQKLLIVRQRARIRGARPPLPWWRPYSPMKSESASLLAKIFAAAFGFALMAAVPLLTGYYVAQAHDANAQSPAVVAEHR